MKPTALVAASILFAPAAAAQGPKFDDDLVEITGPVLTGVLQGLRTEVALRKEFRTLLAKYPTPEQYSTCHGQAAMSEEAQKIMQIMILPDNATDEARQKAMQKYQAEMLAFVKRKCPFDPNEWDETKKAARLAEIETKAVEAANAALNPPGDGDLGSGLGASGPWAAEASVALEALTRGAYRIVGERGTAYCASGLAKPGADLSAANVRTPGTGKNIFWVFTAAEAKALTPNCKELLDLTGQLG